MPRLASLLLAASVLTLPWPSHAGAAVHQFGVAVAAGTPLPVAPAAVAMAASPTGGGYWLADAAGGVFTFGDAGYAGSLPELRAAGVPLGPVRVVAMAASPTGGGYWLAGSGGGVFAFGDAGYAGSLGGVPRESPIVAMAASPTGDGYWLADAAGGVFTFGDAGYAGSLPELRAAGVPLGPVRVVAMAASPTGGGYWLADAAGGVFTFGDAGYAGSLPELRAAGVPLGPVRVVAMAASPTGGGYWLAGSGGGVFAFGDAGYTGSLPELRSTTPGLGRFPAAALAAHPEGLGYWIATRPLATPADGPVSSPFGMRRSPRVRMHRGLDIDTAHGAPIVAAEAGTVIAAGPGGEYGNIVVIDHGGGLRTMYAHQSRLATSPGAFVDRGDLVGYVGSTGHSTGSHLHFEVQIDGTPVDPAPYLRPG